MARYLGIAMHFMVGYKNEFLTKRLKIISNLQRIPTSKAYLKALNFIFVVQNVKEALAMQLVPVCSEGKQNKS